MSSYSNCKEISVDPISITIFTVFSEYVIICDVNGKRISPDLLINLPELNTLLFQVDGQNDDVPIIDLVACAQEQNKMICKTALQLE